MTRPLIVTDCDEVLLHMVAPFRDWLNEEHGIDFNMSGGDFARALTRQGSGERVATAEIWPLLGGFFDGQMHRQMPISGSVQAMAALADHADIVVLTNLQDHRQQARSRQLADHGIAVRVFTNQGPKGPALKAILDEYRPPVAVFIDDLAEHHDSVSVITPTVSRLHLCGEPMLAPHIACAHRAGHAHARIDHWNEALPWLMGQITHNEHAGNIHD